MSSYFFNTFLTTSFFSAFYNSFITQSIHSLKAIIFLLLFKIQLKISSYNKLKFDLYFLTFLVHFIIIMLLFILISLEVIVLIEKIITIFFKIIKKNFFFFFDLY